jgi:hypothetical protein
LIGAALLLAAAVVAAPQDAHYRAALDLLYDGRPAAAQERVTALEAAHPGDPVPAYLQALILAWLVEQRPDSRALDRSFEQAAARAWAMADGLVRRDPADVRARFARGALSGVRSRFHLFRERRSESARAAAQMREDLLAVRARDPEDADVQFGLGLYDYYVDVLPRFARVLRFLSRLPAGDRVRGLAAIEEASRSATLHGVEAQAQLYEIYAFYEDDAEKAAVALEDLFRRYPGWPLWGLKLAEHLRDRLGAYAESAAVARRLLRAPTASRADSGPAARALARLSLGASLILDLEPAEARRVLLPLKDGLPGLPALGAQARLLLGRSLELEGDRDGAAAHYRVGAGSGDRHWRKRAQDALAHPLSPAEAAGRHLLRAARRAREGGQREEAAARAREALEAWPASREAALGVAEDLLRAGDAGVRVPDVDEVRGDEPPWLRAWARLLRAQLADRDGDRETAVRLYKEVYEHPCRRADLRAAAAAGLKAPYRPEAPRSTRSIPPRRRRTSFPTAPGAGFLDLAPFSTAASTG